MLKLERTGIKGKIVLQETGKKRISVWGTKPNCIEVKIENYIEVLASIELDNMETKKLIKELVMQL